MTEQETNATGSPHFPSWHRLLAALETVLGAYQQAIGLAGGTRGGHALQRRSRNPKPGDLVFVWMTLDGSVARTFGWLRDIERGESEYTDRFLIDPISDEQSLWWSNVRVISIPAGDTYGDLLGNPDEVFQPAEGRR